MKSVVRVLVTLFALGSASCATGNTAETAGTSGNTGGSSSSTGDTAGTAGKGGQGASGGADTTSGGGGNGGSGATGGSGAGGMGGSGATGAMGGSTTTSGSGGSVGCGNMTVEAGEDCDGPTGKSCADLGYSGGNVGCTVACTFNLSECSGCGDGVIEQALGEDCDFDAQGDPLVAATCASLGFPFSGANPGCSDKCEFDIRPCQCGNDEIDGSEPCDGTNLNGKTCMSEGFGSGILACTPDCTLDLSGCSLCQNGNIDPGEGCDGANLGGKTCITQGFGGGTLMCTPGCQLDTSGCSLCNNGIINPGESCDGANLGGNTCKTLGFGGGTLSCTQACTFDTSGCSLCGNGTINPGEGCDDGNTANGDGCSAVCQIESMVCDPDGTYTIVGAPIAYTCCFGLVNVNVNSFIFTNNGATIGSSPSNPVSMVGAATTCPSGSFNNTGSIPGGCAETYHLVGSYTNANTWTGTYEIQFSGSDCSCFGGLGVPCVNQLYSVTAQR
ncbi:MAG: hypothetical protein IPK82_17530 [Polyangiaceae bacterium]|nr:hypothetical protein [Polyangiaceae bacterium]